MKNKTTALCILVAGFSLIAGYQYVTAQPNAMTFSRIGVVSVRKVFRDCQLNAKYRAKSIAEQSKAKSAEERLAEEIQAEEQGLKALKIGSEDYLTQADQLFQKKARLEAMRQFNQQKQALQDQRWTERLYEEVLGIVKEMSEEKGLNLVLDVDEPEFPVQNPDELMMSLQTHKVLYDGGCMDLTAEVMAELDKRAPKFGL